MGLSTIKKVSLVLALSFLILIAIGVTSYYSFYNLSKEINLTNHVHETNFRLDRISMLLKDIQGYERGYIITGDGIFFDLFNESVDSIDGQINDIKRLIGKNELEKTTLSELIINTKNLIDTYTHIVTLRKEKGFEPATRIVKTREGKVLLDKVENNINEINSAELSNLHSTVQSINNRLLFSKSIIIIGSVLSLVIVLIFTAALEKDIRRREKVECELRESEELFRSIFEQAAVGAAIVSIEGKILRANQKLCDIVGYTQKEIHLLTFQTLIHPEDLESHLGYVNKLLTGRLINYSMEKRYFKKDNSIVWVNTAVSLVKDVEEKPEYFIAVVEDISLRKKLDLELQELNKELENRVQLRTAQLESSNKELESFSYSVSHDLRAPLRAIGGFSKIIMEDYHEKLDQEGKRMLEIISTNVQKMGRLIDDLLAFSRLGRQAVHKMEVDTGSLIAAIIDELMIEQSKSKIEFKVHKLPKIYADPNLIKQAFTNLLSNAIKYTRYKEHAVVEVGTEDLGREHLFFIKDNGAGFDMRYYAKMFGMFQRLHTDREFEGNGVGLALVQKIILKHDGRIWAEGKPGEGAIFYITIPKSEVNADDFKRSGNFIDRG